MDLPSTVHQSATPRPFKIVDYGIKAQLTWFVIKAPDISESEKSIINSVN